MTISKVRSVWAARLATFGERVRVKICGTVVRRNALSFIVIGVSEIGAFCFNIGAQSGHFISIKILIALLDAKSVPGSVLAVVSQRTLFEAWSSCQRTPEIPRRTSCNAHVRNWICKVRSWASCCADTKARCCVLVTKKLVRTHLKAHFCHSVRVRLWALSTLCDASSVRMKRVSEFISDCAVWNARACRNLTKSRSWGSAASCHTWPIGLNVSEQPSWRGVATAHTNSDCSWDVTEHWGIGWTNADTNAQTPVCKSSGTGGLTQLSGILANVAEDSIATFNTFLGWVVSVESDRTIPGSFFACFVNGVFPLIGFASNGACSVDRRCNRKLHQMWSRTLELTELCGWICKQRERTRSFTGASWVQSESGKTLLHAPVF